ncbi:MAG: guanylate kinase, partial [Acetobacteraceae bacterium]
MAVFIISAPSGSGKTTLVGELFRQVPRLRFSVSYTTRAPRGSEQDGREYYFVDRARFEAMIAAGELLEHADVFGNYYGTARRFVEEAEQAGEDLVLDIDVQGAAQVKQRLSAAVSIFIAPPDRGTLAWRLTSRGLDAQAVIEKRLLAASREIGAYNRYDFVVINDRLPESV